MMMHTIYQGPRPNGFGEDFYYTSVEIGCFLANTVLSSAEHGIYPHKYTKRKQLLAF